MNENNMSTNEKEADSVQDSRFFASFSFRLQDTSNFVFNQTHITKDSVCRVTKQAVIILFL